MPPLRALVFDFDGVLVDSEPAHARSMALMLHRLGLCVPDDMESNWHRFIGRGDRECIIDLFADQQHPATEHHLDLAVQAKAQAFQSPEVQALIRPFMPSLLLLRQAAAAIPVAVCSGSVRDTVERGLERLGVRHLLAAVVTADDVARNKPDPAPYLEAIRRLGVEPAHATAIEDSPTGIASARAAGLYVVGVAHSFPATRLDLAHEVHDTSATVKLGALLARDVTSP